MGYPNLKECARNYKVWNIWSGLFGAAIAAFVMGCATQPAAPRTELVTDGLKSFPESNTWTSNGIIVINSVGSGDIFEAAPGAGTATQWVAPGTSGLLNTFGVLVNNASNTLWVCSSRMDLLIAVTPSAVPVLYKTSPA